MGVVLGGGMHVDMVNWEVGGGKGQMLGLNEWGGF